jgi:hypothetical protein
MKRRVKDPARSKTHADDLTLRINPDPNAARVVETILLPSITDYWDQRSCHLQRLCAMVETWGEERVEDWAAGIASGVTEHAQSLSDSEIAMAAFSMIDDVYKAVSVASDCSDVVKEYLHASAGTLCRIVHDRGYRIHYLVDNTFQEYGGPIWLFGQWFRASGFEYICPQEVALGFMESDGIAGKQFNESLPNYAARSRAVADKNRTACDQRGAHYVYFDADSSPGSFEPSLVDNAETADVITIFRNDAPVKGSKCLLILPVPLRS